MPSSDYPYVRDELNINDRVQAFYDSYQGPDAVVLLARVVRLNIDLKVKRGWPLIIVADLFEGNGHLIDASGDNGEDHAEPGQDGARAETVQHGTQTGYPVGPGGYGTNGGDGSSGVSGCAVTLLCRDLRDVRIKTSGGNATDGKRGGRGGQGADGWYRPAWVETVTKDPFHPEDSYEIPHDAEDVFGTTGGSGGAGGNGGNGGNAGAITILRVREDRSPSLEAKGGQPGQGAPGGARGLAGARADDLGQDGSFGSNGTAGGDGAISTEWTDDDGFGARIRPVIGKGFAKQWASFRVAMGDYHYHRHNPPLGTQASRHAEDAAREFTRALELQPDNAEAIRLREQLVGAPPQVVHRADPTGPIDPFKVADDVSYFVPPAPPVGGGNNALGLPRDLDILPQFDVYQGAYNDAVAQLLPQFQQGMAWLIQVQAIGILQALAGVSLAEADARRQSLVDEVSIREGEKAYNERDTEYLRGQVEQVRSEIEAAMTAMASEDLDVFGVFGKVAEVAGAVVSVVAAIPTGGASLVALVPALVTLSNEVLDGATPLMNAVLNGSKADTDKISAAYDAVDKKASDVIKTGRTIVNLVDAIEKLGKATTSGNPEHVALVKRGAALAHELLMAEQRVALADQRLKATNADLERAAYVVGVAAAAVNLAQVTQESVRLVGLAALGAARIRTRSAARFAFWAQRSVEIYTLKDESQTVSLDAGMISPEIERRYLEGELSEGELVIALQPSVSKLLDPIELKEHYLEYFSLQHDPDTVRLSFTGAELESLKTHHRFSFYLDPNRPNPSHVDAKIRSLRLAIVGARNHNAEISCEVRHGALYEQRQRGGKIAQQFLQPITVTRPAILVELEGDGGLGSDDPLTNPTSLGFWGRGIGGVWELSIRDDQFKSGLDLSTATEVQFWVGYQFVH